MKKLARSSDMRCGDVPCPPPCGVIVHQRKEEQYPLNNLTVVFNIQKLFNKNCPLTNTVREKSRRRDTITQTWYYHTDVILCITQTWYFISDLFYNHLEVGSRVALFKLLKFGPFWTSVCNFFGHFLKNSLFFGPRDLVDLTFWSITQTWYFVWLKYHVSVILHAF